MGRSRAPQRGDYMYEQKGGVPGHYGRESHTDLYPRRVTGFIEEARYICMANNRIEPH